MTRESHARSESHLQGPCAALRRASRAVTHLYDLVLSPTGLKVTQFIVLRAIAEKGEIAQWRLAEEHGIADETLSRRLATLRKSGLVIRRGRELLVPASGSTNRLRLDCRSSTKPFPTSLAPRSDSQ